MKDLNSFYARLSVTVLKYQPLHNNLREISFGKLQYKNLFPNFPLSILLFLHKVSWMALANRDSYKCSIKITFDGREDNAK